METEPLVVKVEDGGGWIILNRPRVMNALNELTLKSLISILHEWKENSEIKYLVIRGEGGVFSGGGDLTEVFRIIEMGIENISEMVNGIYQVSSAVHNFSKPYISIINGIAMGGGMGISIPGSHRIVTEHSKLSMPEAGIGSFPDMGAAFFLNKCPGKIGLYLGLTGKSIGPEDAIFTGLGTHYVLSEEIEKLMTDIRKDKGDNLDELFERYNKPIEGKAPIEVYQDIIDNCFNQPSIEHIFQALAQDNSDFAAQTLSRLKFLSPLSLRTTYDLFKLAEQKTMDEIIEDNRNRYMKWLTIPESLLELKEGFRAYIIEKDKNPKWLSPPIEY